MNQDHFGTEYSIETAATREALWGIFKDVPGWTRWNAGIEDIAIEGPFEVGTWFTMKPPGEEALRSKLVDVRENECFVDETRVGDLVVTVTHRLDPLASGRTRVTYAIEVQGPGASEIGPHIAADFPEVLSALGALAGGNAQ